MRRSLVTLPSLSCGTLKSTRTRTRLFLRSDRSRMVFFMIVLMGCSGKEARNYYRRDGEPKRGKSRHRSAVPRSNFKGFSVDRSNRGYGKTNSYGGESEFGSFPGDSQRIEDRKRCENAKQSCGKQNGPSADPKLKQGQQGDDYRQAAPDSPNP